MSKEDFHVHETGAMKDLSTKLRVDLVAPEMIEGLARVLTYGAKKYSDHNWAKGIPLMTSYAAAMRHLLAWASGIDRDEESGERHIEQALCNIGMIVTQTARNRIDLDNRPTSCAEVCQVTAPNNEAPAYEPMPLQESPTCLACDYECRPCAEHSFLTADEAHAIKQAAWADTQEVYKEIIPGPIDLNTVNEHERRKSLDDVTVEEWNQLGKSK